MGHFALITAFTLSPFFGERLFRFSRRFPLHSSLLGEVVHLEKVKTKSVILLAVILTLSSASALAENIAQDSTKADACVGCASSPHVANNFLALQFFETIHPRFARQKTLPSRVTFEPVITEAKDYESLLVGNWRAQLSCGGRPAEYAEVAGSDYANGLDKPSLTFNFYADMRYERILMRGSLEESITTPVRQVDNEGRWTIEIKDRKEGRILLHYPPFGSGEMQVMRIKETQEVVLVYPELYYRKVCRKGETSQVVFSKVPES